MIVTILSSLLLMASGAPKDVIPMEVLRGSFKTVSSIRALDASVKTELERRVKDPIADAGEPFQSTDLFIANLPRRRFAVAGVSDVSPRFWVACYEHGGLGHHFHVVVFSAADGTAMVVKSGQWLPHADDRRRGISVVRVVVALRKDEVKVDDHW